jgi:hypothetical protein
MIYEIRNHWFINKKVELTNKEHELLMILSNYEWNTLNDISLEMYRSM